MTVQQKNLRAASKYIVEPFKIDISEEVLVDLKGAFEEHAFPG